MSFSLFKATVFAYPFVFTSTEITTSFIKGLNPID